MFVVSLCGCVVSACVESCLRDCCGVSGLDGLPIWVGHSLFWYRCYFLSSLKNGKKRKGGFGDLMGRVVSSR